METCGGKVMSVPVCPSLPPWVCKSAIRVGLINTIMRSDNLINNVTHSGKEPNKSLVETFNQYNPHDKKL